MKDLCLLIIGSFLLFSFPFVYFRSFISGIQFYQLNKSAYNKRKKGETIKEWLLYSKFKHEIPPLIRILYYTFLLLHLLSISLPIALYIMSRSLDISRKIIYGLFIVDCISMVFVRLLFYTSSGNKWDYSRWIPKARGRKRK